MATSFRNREQICYSWTVKKRNLPHSVSVRLIMGISTDMEENKFKTAKRVDCFTAAKNARVQPYTLITTVNSTHWTA